MHEVQVLDAFISILLAVMTLLPVIGPRRGRGPPGLVIPRGNIRHESRPIPTA